MNNKAIIAIINNVFKNSFKNRFNATLLSDFEYELNSHPDFPNLKSISDTFEKFGIENVPVRLKPNELEQLDSPFLAYIKSNGQNELAYARPLGDNSICFISETHGYKTESIHTFSSSFTGIAVLLDIENTVLPDVNTARLKERVLFKLISVLVFVCLLGFLAVGIYNNRIGLFSSATSVILFVTKSLGLTLATALVIKDFGQSGSLLDKVCKLGKKSDCNTVLESKYATVYAWLKWSDLGLIYFLSSFMLVSMGNIRVVALLSLAVVPYIFISLYQQVFLLKKLCPLCLGVITLLGAEFVLSLSSSLSFSFIPLELYNSLMLTLATSTFYLVLKALILSRKIKTELEFRYNRFKRIPQVITDLVKRESQLMLPNIPIHSLSFGYEGIDALKAQVFLSLHCGHCGRLFSQLNERLDMGDKLKIEVFMNFDPNNARQISFMESLSQRYTHGEIEPVWKSIGAWYAQLSNNEFKAQTTEPSESIKNIFISTNNLMRTNQIESLPKLYIEGFEKSAQYHLTDYLENTSVLIDFNLKNQKEEMIINT
ncbi:vitamin K epoxide reductase family protein [Roseivirga echinicomitans]